MIKKIDAISSRIKGGDEAVQKEEVALANLHQQLTTIEAEIEVAEKALPDTGVLIKLNSWFTGRNQMQSNVNKTNKNMVK